MKDYGIYCFLVAGDDDDGDDDGRDDDYFPTGWVELSSLVKFMWSFRSQVAKKLMNLK